MEIRVKESILVLSAELIMLIERDLLLCGTLYREHAPIGNAIKNV